MAPTKEDLIACIHRGFVWAINTFHLLCLLSLLTGCSIMMWFSVMFQRHGFRLQLSRQHTGSRNTKKGVGRLSLKGGLGDWRGVRQWKMEKSGLLYPKVGNKLQMITSSMRYKQQWRNWIKLLMVQLSSRNLWKRSFRMTSACAYLCEQAHTQVE